MPTFKDFLFAPWKTLSLLFSGGPSPEPVTSAAVHPAASGPLCSYQNIGDQILHTCHIGSYEMPAFIFWASCIIFLIFLTASIGLLLQCLQVARVLRSLSKRVASLKTSGRYVTAHELAAISQLMRSEDLVSHSWQDFEDTLLSSGPDIYSTNPVESVLSKAVLIDENVHTALFSAIPGILTGLGLLMTFVAILDGLSHVSVAANMDVKGIGGLINGLSGKFVSSIVAVTCAVLYVFVERFAYAQPHSAYRQLMSKVSNRFKRRTTEHLLLSIENHLRQQAQPPKGA